MCFVWVYDLGVAYKRAAGALPPAKTVLPDLGIMSILGIVRIVRISIYIDLGTCLKRRAPKNHEFGGTKTSRSLTASRLVNKTMN